MQCFLETLCIWGSNHRLSAFTFYVIETEWWVMLELLTQLDHDFMFEGIDVIDIHLF